MMRALYSSVSGLKTHQTKMDVLGNNIANVNTVGFKSSRTTFSTMMYQTTSYASGANAETGKGGVNAKQIGLGTSFASTAMDIDTGGASESTGRAFDLKLSDTNSTSFYIVNTGAENVFTRAGAFYVDGAGNLCMESTGYTVMGWQVDANGNIRKDTVSPLRIMDPANQTSQPEYTTKAICSGILDDNNSNVNADTGYAMNLNFYDNLGYAYTAKFAAQKTGENGEYAINLTDILDSNGKSIIAGTDITLSSLFGTESGQGSNVDISDNFKMATGMSGALKRLAATPDTTTVAEGTLTYTFPAGVVNQYLAYTDAYRTGSSGEKYEMDDGYTVKYTATYANPTTYEMKLYDSSGREVDVADNLPAGWLDTNNEITKVVTPQELLQEWLDKGELDKDTNQTDGVTAGQTAYLLKQSQIEKLGDVFSNIVGENANANGVTARVVVGGTTSAPTFTLAVTPPGGSSGGGTGGGGTTATGWGGLNINSTREYRLRDYLDYGYITVDAKAINDKDIFTTGLPLDAELRYYQGDGHYQIVTPSTDGFEIKFSTADGSLTYIGQQGSTTQTLRMSNYRLDGDDNPIPFSDIQIDFSTLKNLANGASCTAAMEAGSEGVGEGKRVGTMIGLSVDQSGKIYGSYSNGDTALLGQIAVARFANASGLESIGNNCYKTTMNSGQFDGIGVEMDSDGSTIDSGVLEMSNVDLSQEFTQMITTQRGFQANSRVISTSDGILEELVNLKR